MTQSLKTNPLPETPHWLRANMKGAAAVDRDKHIINGVILAEEGPFKSEGRGEFDRQGIRAIVKMANDKPGGLKSRFAHPGLSSDGVGSFLGRMRDAYSEKITRDAGADDAGRPLLKEVLVAKANLHLDPSSFDSPNGNLGKYVEDLAESDPDAFGTSLVLQVDQEFRVDKKGIPLKDDKGDDLPPLWTPTKLHASDVVDEGDATNSFLSADILASLPDAIVRQGCELLDKQFAGQERDVIKSRLSAFVDRYLAHRFGEEETEEELEKQPPVSSKCVPVSSEQPSVSSNEAFLTVPSDEALRVQMWLAENA